ASLMLYGTTTNLTQDIVPMPFLWIIPLVLYLLSFVICFDNDRWYLRGGFHPMLAVAIFLGFVLISHSSTVARIFAGRFLAPQSATLVVQIVSSLFLLFLVCMVFHGELVMLPS